MEVRLSLGGDTFNAPSLPFHHIDLLPHQSRESLAGPPGLFKLRVKLIRKWPSSGAPYRSSIPSWRHYQYHPYHSPATMGKKPASQQSSISDAPPHLQDSQATDGKQGALPRPSPQSHHLPQQRQHDIQAQSVYPLNQPLHLSLTSAPEPQRQPQRYPAQHRGHLNSYTDSHGPRSRYTPPQTRSQRRAIHAIPADHPIPSIETSIPQTNQPPWRLPLRNAQSKPTYGYRRSQSNTPGIPDRPVTPPLAPKPTQAYLERAREIPQRLPEPKKLLLLLDLNGTLLYRPRLPDHAPHRQRREHILRPGAANLIDYLFENHAVMVYTSAMRRNAEVCVEALLRHLAPEQRSRLIDIRPREQLGLTKSQLNARVQVYKPLEPVWGLEKVVANGIENGCKWDDTNTVLLDDSLVKAISNPHNLLQVPEFKLPDGTKDHNMSAEIQETETMIMEKVQQKLEELKWEVSVTRKIREWQEKKETLIDTLEIEGQDRVVTSKTQTKTEEISDALASVTVTDAVAAYPTSESTGSCEATEESDEGGGVKVKSPTPVVEKDFDFVDGSKKEEAQVAEGKRYLDLSQETT